MGRLYLDERELRAIGMSEPMIRTLRRLTEFVEAQEAIEATQGQLDATEADLATLTTAVNANTATNATQNGRLDIIEADYVQKGQAPAPAFSGQTITNPPTQAEVQAIDDALAALITALQTAEVLT